MGNASSREIIESYDKRIKDLENRVLELEQRVFLGMRKDKNGHLVFEKDIDNFCSRSSSIDTEVNDIYMSSKLQGYRPIKFS